MTVRMLYADNQWPLQISTAGFSTIILKAPITSRLVEEEPVESTQG